MASKVLEPPPAPGKRSPFETESAQTLPPAQQQPFETESQQFVGTRPQPQPPAPPQPQQATQATDPMAPPPPAPGPAPSPEDLAQRTPQGAQPTPQLYSEPVAAAKPAAEVQKAAQEQKRGAQFTLGAVADDEQKNGEFSLGDYKAEKDKSQDFDLNASDAKGHDKIASVDDALSVYKKTGDITDAYARGDIDKTLAMSAISVLQAQYQSGDEHTKKGMLDFDRPDQKAAEQGPQPEQGQAASWFSSFLTAAGPKPINETPISDLRNHNAAMVKDGTMTTDEFNRQDDLLQKAQDIWERDKRLKSFYGLGGSPEQAQAAAGDQTAAMNEIKDLMTKANPDWMSKRFQQAQTELTKSIPYGAQDLWTWLNKSPIPELPVLQQDSDHVSKTLDDARKGFEHYKQGAVVTPEEQKGIAAEVKAKTGKEAASIEEMEQAHMAPKEEAVTGLFPAAKEVTEDMLSLLPMPWEPLAEMGVNKLLSLGGSGVELAGAGLSKGGKWLAGKTWRQMTRHPLAGILSAGALANVFRDPDEAVKRLLSPQGLQDYFVDALELGGIPLAAGMLAWGGGAGARKVADILRAGSMHTPLLWRGIARDTTTPFRAGEKFFTQLGGRSLRSYLLGASRVAPFSVFSGDDPGEIVHAMHDGGTLNALMHAPSDVYNSFRGSSFDRLFVYKGEDPTSAKYKAPPPRHFGDHLDAQQIGEINKMDPSRKNTALWLQDTFSPYANTRFLPDDVVDHEASIRQGAQVTPNGFVIKPTRPGQKMEVFIKSSKFDPTAFHEVAGHVPYHLLSTADQARLNSWVLKTRSGDIDKFVNNYAQGFLPETKGLKYSDLPTEAEIRKGDPSYNEAKASFARSIGNLTQERAAEEMAVETMGKLFSGDLITNWTKNPSLIRQGAYFVGSAMERMGLPATTPDVDGPLGVPKGVLLAKIMDPFMRDVAQQKIPITGATREYIPEAHVPGEQVPEITTGTTGITRLPPGQQPPQLPGGQPPPPQLPGGPQPPPQLGGPPEVPRLPAPPKEETTPVTPSPGEMGAAPKEAPLETPVPTPESPPGPEKLTPEQQANIRKLRQRGQSPGEAQAKVQGRKAQTLKEQREGVQPIAPGKPRIRVPAARGPSFQPETTAPAPGRTTTVGPPARQQQDDTGTANYFSRRGEQPIRSDSDSRLTSVRVGNSEWRVHKEAAPYFQGFLNELASKGAPVSALEPKEGWNYRNVAGTNKLSEHSYGGAIDVNQTGRNQVTEPFRKWLAANPGALQEAERRWHIYGGERFGDLGHFEWGGQPFVGPHAGTVQGTPPGAGQKGGGGTWLKGTSTSFGLNYDGSIDQDDNGRGIFGANTRDPKLKGVAVPVDVLERTFGKFTQVNAQGGYDLLNTPEAKAAIQAIRSAHVEVADAQGNLHPFPIVDIQGTLGRHPGKVLDLTYGAAKELGFNDNHEVAYQLVGGDGTPYPIGGGEEGPLAGGAAPQPAGAPEAPGPYSWRAALQSLPAIPVPSAPGAPAHGGMADTEPQNIYSPYQMGMAGGYGYGGGMAMPSTEYTGEPMAPAAPGGIGGGAMAFMPGKGKKRKAPVQPEEEESTSGEPSPEGFEPVISSLGKGTGAGLQRALELHTAALSPDDKRVRKRDRGRFKGEYFLEGDPVHKHVLDDTPYEEKRIMGHAQKAIANKEPMHITYASAPKLGLEEPPTTKSRKVEYGLSSPQARILRQTEATEAGHSLIPLSVGVKMASKKGEPHEGYIEGISGNVAASNWHHLNGELASMGEQTPYPHLDNRFYNDLEGYISNVRAGHTGTGDAYAQGTEEHPIEVDESHVPYNLNRNEADFINAVLNNQKAKTKDQQGLRELARKGGTLLSEEGETNPFRHRINERQKAIRQAALDRNPDNPVLQKAAKKAWSDDVLEPTIRTFKAGLVRDIHASYEDIPEAIRPGEEHKGIMEAFERAHPAGPAEVPISVAFMPSTGYVSPNVAEGTKIPAAVRQLYTRPHVKARDFYQRVEDASRTGGRHGGTVMPTVGNWEGTAEGSSMIHDPDDTLDEMRVKNAIRGLHSGQLGTASFELHDGGQDRLYDIDFPNAGHEQVDKLIFKHGFPANTIYEGPEGHLRAHIIDPGGSKHQEVADLVRAAGSVRPEYHAGTAAFDGGDSRPEAARSYRRILGGSGIQTREGPRRSGLRGDTPEGEHPLQSLYEEAEDNYQRLAAEHGWERPAGRMAFMPMAGKAASGFGEAEQAGKVFPSPVTGGPRFEIDDRSMGIKDAPAGSRFTTLLAHQQQKDPYRNGGRLKLSQAIEHPELFKQYPFLRNTHISYDPSLDKEEGLYEPPELDERGRQMGDHIVTGDPENKQTIIHEVQHAIQHFEKFAGKGTNPDAMKNALLNDKETREDLVRAWEARPDFEEPHTMEEHDENIRDFQKWVMGRVNRMAYYMYNLDPGEIEARVAGRRAGYANKPSVSPLQELSSEKQWAIKQAQKEVSPKWTLWTQNQPRYGGLESYSRSEPPEAPESGGELAFMAGKPKAEKLTKPKGWEDKAWMKDPANEAERQAYLEKRVAASLERQNTHSSAIPLKVQRKDDGGVQHDPNLNPVWEKTDYNLSDLPFLQKNGKGLSGIEGADKHEDTLDEDEHKHLIPKDRRRLSAMREASAVSTLGDRIVESYNKIKDIPEIAAGKGWYSRMREKMAKVFGAGEGGKASDDHELFAQLLGATSAKTPVRDNFIQALDAFEQFKAGKFDRHIKLYKQAYKAMQDGGYEALNQLMRKHGIKDEDGNFRQGGSDAEAMAHWIDHHQIMPKKQNGAKYNSNSEQVLKVLAGKWLGEVGAPKTPNFAGNLTGRTLQATIDVWAARHLHRLGHEHEGEKEGWRPQAAAEPGVNDLDFAFAQDAMKHAADKIGINPDDLQAILWYAEKHHYDERGWTGSAGAEKGSFDETWDKAFPEEGKAMGSKELQSHYQAEKAREDRLETIRGNVAEKRAAGHSQEKIDKYLKRFADPFLAEHGLTREHLEAPAAPGAEEEEAA